MTESLRLVDHFGQLATGMIVVSKCSCGAKHRGILGNPRRDSHGPMFSMLPIPSCCMGAEFYVVRSQAVEVGNVWLVVDLLEGPSTVVTQELLYDLYKRGVLSSTEHAKLASEVR